MFKYATVFFICLCHTLVGRTQNNYAANNICLTTNEQALYQLINQYRKENNLPAIPLSPALCFVAQTHAKDLMDNKVVKNNCNMHSWSNKGNWSSCCYTANHAQAACMWNKPRELTNYKGDGYEITFWIYKSDDPDYTATATEALNGWKKSEGHRNVIINKSTWQSLQWNAIGIGIYKNYACVWFGTVTDNNTITCSKE
jgi:hypothetical protein